jgi:hypothetical protein
MRFDFDSQPPVVRIAGRTAGHCPGFENAVEFEAEIVVKAPDGTFLNDKPAASRWGDDFAVSCRLERPVEISLGAGAGKLRPPPRLAHRAHQ